MNTIERIGKGIVIVGCQFGDEGKGKVVDYYASKPSISAVVRFNGGSNTGHTVVTDKTYALHLVPAGLIYGKPSFIGNGVVLNRDVLKKELELFSEKAIKFLKIDPRIHIVLPLHIALDGFQEEIKSAHKADAGTTKQGIGPTYGDKILRFGIRIADLDDEILVEQRLQQLYDYYNVIIDKKSQEKYSIPSLAEMKQELIQFRNELKPFIAEVGEELENFFLTGHNVLFEGAQATLLDIDHGIYPYGTSSTCIVAGASSGSGIGVQYLNERLGIVKAYTSRVGSGPFAGELSTADGPGKLIQQEGVERGTTTGRPRRVGWLDLVAIKYSARINGLTGICLTKVDIIGMLDTFNVITAYQLPNNKISTQFPPIISMVENYRPIFKTFKGWGKKSQEEWAKIIEQGSHSLPDELHVFIKFLEEYLHIPVYLISLGPKRSATLELVSLEQKLK